jgi:hypothetical protein
MELIPFMVEETEVREMESFSDITQSVSGRGLNASPLSLPRICGKQKGLRSGKCILLYLHKF